MNTVKETTTNIDHPSAVAMTSHPMFRFEPLSAPFPMEEYDTLLPASNPVNTIATARDQAADIDSEASLQLVAVGEESANKDRVVSEETGQDQVETDKNSDMAEIFPAGILSRPDSPRLLCDTQGKGPNSAAMIEEVPRQTDVLLTGRALYNHELEEESELSFRELDEVEIVDQSEILGDEGWYKGRLKNTTKIGLLPVLYVETDEEAVERHPPKSSEANATDLTKLSKRALDEPPVLIAHRHKEVVESIDTLSTSTDNMEPLNLNHVWTFQGIMQKQEPVAVVSPLLEHSEQVYRLSAIFKQTLNMPQFLFDGCLGFARLFEPRLKPGKKRIRWTCKCGHQGYDDFIELRWGAVAEYEASLRQYNNGGRQQSASPGGGILSRCTQAIRGIAGSMRNKSSNNDLGLPQFESQHKQINLTSRPSNNALDSLFLLLCIPHQKFATKLLHLELRETSSDREFFGLLMKSYNDMRGRLRSYLSLKSLRTIKFVQFEMYKSELVDIRKVDDVPPIDRKDEYRYRPIPAEIIPPIGENHMMHLCTHPEDADDSDLICLNRIPKKLKERLLVDPARGTGLGWGVHFVEGWRYNVIWLLAFIVLLFSSLVFLICWAVLQHDIQGASGVAAYMLAFVALGIGSIQAAFELN
ncbi:hypothetical protein MMC19_001084 [Ptychographa xylographoides]|nr:hypothetical protein [Ptychographa xylographoides]